MTVAREIVMPRLSDSMEEGTILSWLVAEGDTVERGQPLVEIETDKATVAYEADDGGVILALSAAEGATVPVGGTIAVIGEAGEKPRAVEGVGVASAAAGAASPVAAARPARPARPADPASPARPAAPARPARAK